MTNTTNRHRYLQEQGPTKAKDINYYPGFYKSDIQASNQFLKDLLCFICGWRTLEVEFLLDLIQIYFALHEESQSVADIAGQIEHEELDRTSCDAWIGTTMESIFGHICDVLVDGEGLWRREEFGKKVDALYDNFNPEIDSIYSKYNNFLDDLDFSRHPGETSSKFLERVVEQSLTLLRDMD